MPPKPSMGFELLRQTGILQFVWPELIEGVGVDQNEWHAYDVYRHNLETLDSVPPGGRVAVVVPQVYSLAQWRAPWTSLVRERSEEWLAFLEADSRFARTDVEPDSPEPRPPNPVRAEVFVRR